MRQFACLLPHSRQAGHPPSTAWPASARQLLLRSRHTGHPWHRLQLLL